jgi:hypothetical protein
MELIVTSAYLPYDSEEPLPTKKLRDITDYCSSRKEQLIIGCDGNACCIVQENTGTNPKK